MVMRCMQGPRPGIRKELQIRAGAVTCLPYIDAVAADAAVVVAGDGSGAGARIVVSVVVVAVVVVVGVDCSRTGGWNRSWRS